MKFIDLKMIRDKKNWLGVGIFALCFAAFQNCAPSSQNTICTGDCPKDAAAGAGSQSSASSDSLRGIASIGGPGSSGSSSSGMVGGSGGGGSTGTSLGGSIPGGVTSGGTFRILTQPQNLTVGEGTNFQLTVDLAGGTAPYTFRWYKDGAALSVLEGSSYFLALNADRYSKEGSYYMRATDSTGAVLQTNTVRVGVNESNGPCDATQYMMFNAPGKDSGMDMIGLFDNPHGKFLVNKNNSEVSWMNGSASYFNLSYFNFTPGLQDGQSANISCRTTIARIHTPVRNPSTIYTTVGMADTADFVYTGAVTFICRNQKYKLVANSCAWKPVPGFRPPSGSNKNDSHEK